MRRLAAATAALAAIVPSLLWVSPASAESWQQRSCNVRGVTLHVAAQFRKDVNGRVNVKDTKWAGEYDGDRARLGRVTAYVRFPDGPAVTGTRTWTRSTHGWWAPANGRTIRGLEVVVRGWVGEGSCVVVLGRAGGVR